MHCHGQSLGQAQRGREGFLEEDPLRSLRYERELSLEQVGRGGSLGKIPLDEKQATFHRSHRGADALMKRAVPNVFGTSDWFCRRRFFHGLVGGGGGLVLG